jgi:uncharacterized protein (TIGR03067 family)
MRLFTVSALALVLPAASSPSLTLAQDGRKALIKQELKKLQGVWALTSRKEGADAIPDETVKKLAIKLIIEPGKAIITDGAHTVEASLTIDPLKSPKQIDMRGTLPGGQAQKELGIYRLEGDTLTYCFVTKGNPRPTAFEAQLRSDQVLETFRREKK